jgi:2-polyprenyl-3-methyl-5-hydroxy-6-metoxy-1,4-benzoquinol methylase
MDAITSKLKQHYSETFERHGPNARGVDWSAEADVLLRYDNMLNVIPVHDKKRKLTFLDVGCGFGGLFEYATQQGYTLDYTGIDVCENMIIHAKHNYPAARFECMDIFDLDEKYHYDYVVCNGILTQKLSSSILEMDKFAQALIRKLYRHSNQGLAFNIMTSKVNYMVDNLYYRNPVELLAWCLSEISSHIRLDHSYRLYEYTTYIYKGAQS